MKLGFIGAGNMATAIMSGVVKSGIVPADEIIASNRSTPCLEKHKENLHIHTTTNNREAAQQADIIFLAVKPQFYEAVIHEIADDIKEHQIIVSIAPGKTIEWLKNQFGKDVKVVRTMPNTPAMVGEGMTAVCPADNITEADLKEICDILGTFGKVEVITENLMAAVVSLSGSSPAYIYMLIEAMADAGVADGMPRAKAYKFAAQAVLGSAKMVLETGEHPGALKDAVCSPAGTTIQAVKILEEKGFRSSVMEAMTACAQKSREM